jgi:hypothetical protein
MVTVSAQASDGNGPNVSGDPKQLGVGGSRGRIHPVAAPPRWGLVVGSTSSQDEVSGALRAGFSGPRTTLQTARRPVASNCRPAGRVRPK